MFTCTQENIQSKQSPHAQVLRHVAALDYNFRQRSAIRKPPRSFPLAVLRVELSKGLSRHLPHKLCLHRSPKWSWSFSKDGSLGYLPNRASMHNYFLCLTHGESHRRHRRFRSACASNSRSKPGYLSSGWSVAKLLQREPREGACGKCNRAACPESSCLFLLNLFSNFSTANKIPASQSPVLPLLPNFLFE